MPTSRARELRRNQTDAERLLWQQLRRRQIGGHRFRRQHPIERYVVDFFCFEKGLVVEIYGGQHATKAAHEVERTASLERRGYRVLRFWNNQVLTELEAVKEAILLELTAEERPLLNSPPEGEETLKNFPQPKEAFLT